MAELQQSGYSAQGNRGIKPEELGVKPEWAERVAKAESPAVQRELGRGSDLSEVRRTYKGKIASLRRGVTMVL